MTKFHQWVAAQPLTVGQIADALGAHRVTIHRYMAGTTMPRPHVASAIARLTGGAVSESDLAAGYRGRRGEA